MTNYGFSRKRKVLVPEPEIADRNGLSHLVELFMLYLFLFIYITAYFVFYTSFAEGFLANEAPDEVGQNRRLHAIAHFQVHMCVS